MEVAVPVGRGGHNVPPLTPEERKRPERNPLPRRGKRDPHRDHIDDLLAGNLCAVSAVERFRCPSSPLPAEWAGYLITSSINLDGREVERDLLAAPTLQWRHALTTLRMRPEDR